MARFELAQSRFELGARLLLELLLFLMELLLSLLGLQARVLGLLGATSRLRELLRHAERQVCLLSRLTRHRLPLLALGIELGGELGEFGLAGVGELDCLSRAL